MKKQGQKFAIAVILQVETSAFHMGQSAWVQILASLPIPASCYCTPWVMAEGLKFLPPKWETLIELLVSGINLAYLSPLRIFGGMKQ